MTNYEVIKKLCENRGIAITALEQELGFGRGSIGKLKEGGMMASSRAKKVADYFGVSVEYLLTGETPSDGYYLDPATAEAAQEIFENRELRLLFDAARDITPEQLKMLHALALSWKK